MKKVLVVTYYWPPAGGISVQRTMKFCTYLRTWGWEPIVLTVENGNFQILDESLLAEVEDLGHVYRASSLEPHGLYHLLARSFRRKVRPAGTSPPLPTPFLWRLGEYVRLNLFIPDARIGWRRRALKKGGEIIAEEQPDAILSTAPPYTSHLIAMELKRRFRLPWVADFRDLWLENHVYNTVSRLGIVKAVNSLLERRVLENADGVVCANPGIMKLTSAKVSASAKHKFTVITNGYDAREVRPATRVFRALPCPTSALSIPGNSPRSSSRPSARSGPPRRVLPRTFFSGSKVPSMPVSPCSWTHPSPGKTWLSIPSHHAAHCWKACTRSRCSC